MILVEGFGVLNPTQKLSTSSIWKLTFLKQIAARFERAFFLEANIFSSLGKHCTTESNGRGRTPKVGRAK